LSAGLELAGMSQRVARAGLAVTRTVHTITAAGAVDAAVLEVGAETVAVAVSTAVMCAPPFC
jgi:molybdopterin-binding protein